VTRVAVLGASGFVGATLMERWLASGRVEPKAIIHSTGNAWRLARHGIELHVVDTLDRESLTTAFAGCTHVVNCARGGREVMLRGLENALAAAAAARVRRFVHLSSIAIFAELPPNEIASERSPARPAKGSYGWLKLEQDALVARAHDRGLSSVVLCPTHIFGAYSQFLLVCIAALRARRFALVDEGALPASFVDVSNLCAAIELALECERSDGRAIVIEDDQKLTWRDVAEALAPLADAAPPFPSVERERALVRARETLAPPSLRGALRVLASHLTSSAFKNVLKSDPMLSSLGESGLRTLRRLPGPLGKRLLRAASGAPPQAEGAPSFDDWSLRAQALSVRFATDRARELLGYKPERSFGESMAALASWYRATHGHGTADAALLRQL
jgi:nucleoside-diphosphate-sugar epimerase